VKGIPITELPKSLVRLRKFPHILETDYSSFESGFSPEYVDNVECALWRYVLKNNPETLDAVMRTYYEEVNGCIRPRKERLYSRYYTARCVGARMSGEMWTSLANGFSNLMNIMFLCDDLGVQFDGFVEGDDGLFGLSEDTLNEDHFAALGFKIDMLYGSDLRHTSFCGNVFDPSELNLVVSPEQIARASWTCAASYLLSRRKKRLALLRAKAMSLYCIGKHTPIAAELAYRVMTLIGAGDIILEPGTLYWKSNIMKLAESEVFRPPVITRRSRELFWEKYGFLPEEQVEMECKIRRARTLQELSLPRRFMETSILECERIGRHH
jgi:hypothetical protein